MDVICAYFQLCDFDRFDPIILVLYGCVIMFVRCTEKTLMWCLKILAHEDYMKDIEVLQVANGPILCSFRFKTGQAPNKGEDQDVTCDSILFCWTQ